MQLELLYLSVFLCISLNKHSETHVYCDYLDDSIVEAPKSQLKLKKTLKQKPSMIKLIPQMMMNGILLV